MITESRKSKCFLVFRFAAAEESDHRIDIWAANAVEVLEVTVHNETYVRNSEQEILKLFSVVSIQPSVLGNENDISILNFA